MDLELTANKIASKYLKSNVDMNESIAKYAAENNLNIEQTKRLVEESNKTCYLQKFASTGEQTFDIAQFNIVKEKIGLLDKVEKTAAIKFTEYSDLEKVAEENQIDTLEYQLAIDKCRKEIGEELTKVASYYRRLVYEDPSLEKLAYSEVPALKKDMDKIAHKEKVIDYLIEKRAGIISGLAGGALKGSAKVVGKVGGYVAEAPIKRGLMPASYIGSFKEGMKKVPDSTGKFIMNKAAEVTKEAGVFDKVIQALGENLVPALALGSVGVGIAAARGAGGIVSRMMQERQLNDSFNTIAKANADIRNIPNARDYFDVIARHSPSLALDPMVAPSLIRQFDTFNGVDVNTVGKLREIQDRGSRNDSPSILDMAGSFTKGFDAFKKKDVKPVVVNTYYNGKPE